MARNQGELRFGVGFNVDKSGLNELKTSLQQLQNLTVGDIVGADSIADAKRKLSDIKDTAIEVEKALAKSFNPTLNTYDINKFNKEIAKTSGGVASLGAAWVNAGASGTQAMISMASALTSIQLPLKETHSLLTSMGNTLANTIRWTIASQGINSVTGSIQKAWSFTKQLDTSLNNIRIVTEKSSEEMERFAKQANNAAKSLGATTKSYTEAALIYYQQGLSDQEVQARAETTVKVANVTGQSADTVSEQLTAIWNGYKVSSQEAELYIDKVSAVAATTAADLEELATGMSKVASAANIMGVDIDQLNAQLATIVSVTREAPESIGTALKTVYARMSDIEAGLDTETTLGEYTSQMQALGIEALDASGNLRDQGDVIEEIGNKWDTFNRNQQVALAQIIAGTRQYSRMMALFDNWDMYEQALSTSQGSAGALQKQQDIYLDSLEAKLEKLNTTVEELYLTLFDSDSFKTLIDIASVAIKVFDTLIETVGGGGVVFSALIPIILKLTSSNIAQGIGTFASNFRSTKNEAELLKQALENINQILASDQFDQTSKSIVELRKRMIELRQAGIITNEEFNTLEQSLKEMETTANTIVANRYDKEQVKTKYTNLAKNFLSGSETNLDIDIDRALDAGAAAVNAGGVFTDAKKDDQNFQNYLHNIRSIKDNVQEQADTIKAARKAFEQYKKSLGTDKEEANLEDLKKKLKEVDQAAKVLSGDVGDNTFLTKNEKNSVQARARNLNKAINAENFEPTTAALKKMEEQVSSLEVSYGKVSEKLNKEVIPSFEGADKESGKAAQNLNTFNSISARVKDTIAKWNFEQKIKQLTEITAGFASAATAIVAFQNIGSIWDSKDLTLGQKILQTITNFSVGVSALVPVLNSIKTIHELWNAAKVKSVAADVAATAATILQTAATKENTDATKENAFWKSAVDLMSKDDDEQIRNIALAIQEQNGAIDENTKALIANYLAKKLNNGEKLDLGDADSNSVLDSIQKQIKNPKSTKSFGKIKEFFSKNGKNIGRAFGFAIAAAATALAIKSLYDLYHKEKKLTEQAQETASIAKEEYDNIRSSYDELMETISDYKDAKTSIDELTHGTQEWRMAVNDLNHDVLGLMTAYEGLSKYVTNEGGVLTISDAGLDYIQKQKEQEVNNALAVQSIAAAEAARAQNDYEATQVSRDKELEGTESAAVDNTKTTLALAGLVAVAAAATVASVMSYGAATPAAIAAWSGVAAAAGGVAGGLIGHAADAIDESEEGEKNTWKTAARLYSEDNSVFKDRESLTKAWYGADKTFQQLDKTQQALIDSLLANTEQISILSGKLGNENSQEQIARQQAANAYISNLGLESFENSAFQGQISKTFSSVIGEAEYEAARNQRDKDNDKTNQQVYAERMGYVWISNNNNGTGTFKRRNSDGTLSEAFDLEDDFIRAANAYIDAFDASKNKLTPIIDKFNKLNSALNNADLAQQVANLASGLDVNLGALTEQELQEFANYAKTHFEVLWLNIQDSWNAHLSTSQNIGNSLEGAAKQIFDELAPNLSMQGKKNVLPYLEDASEFQLDLFEELFNEAPEIADDLARALSTFDWEQNDASLKLVEFIETQFPQISSDLAQSFGNEYEKIVAANNFNLSKTQTYYSSLNQVLSSLKTTGDIISKEDYFEILGDQYEEYFITMEDGSKKLVADAKKFYDVVYQEKVDSAQQGLEESVEKYQKWQAAKETVDKGPEKSSQSYNYNINATDVLNSGNLEGWRWGVSLEELLEGKTFNFGEFFERYNPIGSTATTYAKVSEEDRKTLQKAVYALAERGLITDDQFQRWISDLTDNETVYTNTILGIAQQLRYPSTQEGLSATSYEIETPSQKYLDAQEFVNNYSPEELKNQITEAADNVINILGSDILNEEWTQIFTDAGQADKLNEARQEYLDKFKALYESNEIFDTSSFEYYTTKILPQMQRQVTVLTSEYENLQTIMNFTTSYEEQNSLLDDQISKIQEIASAKKNYWEGLKEQNRIFENNLQGYFNDFNLNALGIDTSAWLENPAQYAEEIKAAMQTAGLFTTDQDYNDWVNKFDTYLNNIESGIPDALEDYQNSLYETTQLNLQKLDLQLANDIETTEAQKSYNDFLRSIAQEDGYSDIATSYLSDYTAGLEAVRAYQEDLLELEHYRIVTSLEGYSAEEIARDKIITQADYETRKLEVINKLREEGLSAQEALAQVTQTVVDYQDAITESYQDQVNLLENIVDSYEHLISLNELIYGDKAITKTVGYYNKINEQNKAIMETREAELAVAASAYQDALNSGNDDLIQSTQETYIAANQAYQDSIIAYAESAQEAFLKATEARIAEFKGDIEKYKDDWDWRKNADEDFLDEFDALTGISKVEAAYNKSLNSTTNLTARQKLKTLMDEELKLLREKDKLTQYDLDRANKRLEIEQARIALEEAQQNKTKMRLTRGADGTYSYEYVADQTAIDEKRAELESLQNELVHLDEEELENSLDKAYDLYVQFLDDLEAAAADGNLSVEELDALAEKYGERMQTILDYIYGENGISNNVVKSIADMNALIGTNVSIGEIFEGYGSEFYDQMKSFAQTGIKGSLQEVANEVAAEKKEFDEAMNGVNGEGGILSALEDAVGTFVTAIGDEESGMFKSAQDATEALNQMSDAIWGENGVVASLKSFALQLEGVLGNIKSTTEPGATLIPSFVNESSAIESIGYSTETPKDIIQLAAMANSNVGNIATMVDYGGVMGWTSSEINEEFENMYETNPELFEKIKAAVIKYYEDFYGFDTGGYTGEWGADGRLAMLHEKELVLNKVDTENILNAVDIVRDLQFSLDASITARLVEMMESYERTVQAFNNATGQVIEQHVEINAEFPNATDHNEIEEAFRELLNMATQRIAER